MNQTGKRILAERLAAWLRAQGRRSSMRALSIKSGNAENAVQRILESPDRATERVTWEKLARYLGWDLEETLGLAGYGQAPEPAGENSDLLLERAMAIWNLDTEAREHMRRQVQLLRRIPAASTPEPPHHSGGPHPTLDHTQNNSTERWPEAAARQ